ncbi:hypothetical protein BC831DRAFT_249697 [Entophlyctis helioformis]|nr:hypothetical protein BC831DRAFT_249697 [Entophlyctis helioformis]
MRCDAASQTGRASLSLSAAVPCRGAQPRPLDCARAWARACSLAQTCVCPNRCRLHGWRHFCDCASGRSAARSRTARAQQREPRHTTQPQLTLRHSGGATGPVHLQLCDPSGTQAHADSTSQRRGGEGTLQPPRERPTWRPNPALATSSPPSPTLLSIQTLRPFSLPSRSLLSLKHAFACLSVGEPGQTLMDKR